MAKKSPKTSASRVAKKRRAQKEDLAFLNDPKTIVAFFVVLFVAVVILYKPIVLEGKDVTGSDVLSSLGNTKQIKDYRAETGQQPLWNPYMFAGTPIYHRLNAVSWSLDTLLRHSGGLLDWRIWYLLLGAIGIFLLVKSLGLGNLSAMLAAIGFMLIPHFQALIAVGHFSKLRALAWMPWVMLAFRLMQTEKSWFSMFCFTAAFALQLRTQHYQIVFYTILLLFFTGIWPVVKMAMEQRWKEFGRFSAMFAGSLGLVVMIVAQPLFVTSDYTPYSTRGGKSINLQEDVTEKDAKGVGFDYATNWSYTVTEFWNLIIPKFHGGVSQERYEGDAVPQFKGRVLPTYWGDLPFTQSLEYISVLMVFLALIGIIFQWRRTEVRALTALTVLALLLSLGKHFAALYKLFFYYLPQFDKFRVPMMILTLVGFSVCLLAAYGLQYLLSGESADEKKTRFFYFSAGGYLLLLIIPVIFGSSFSLSPAGEVQRYQAQMGAQAQQIVDLLKQARLDILMSSTWRSIFFFIIGAGLLSIGLRGIISKKLAALLLVVLVGLDLGVVSYQYLQGRFDDPKLAEEQRYRANELDLIVKKDPSLFRVLPPLRTVGSDSRFTYHHQSIGGYSAAKLQVIQDIIANCLIQRTTLDVPMNMNVVNMLNGKYIFSQRPYDVPFLELRGQIQEGLYLYENRQVLPRAFFVGQAEVIEDGVTRLQKLNSPSFDPSQLALLEKPLSTSISLPDSNSNVQVVDFKPDRVEIEYNSNVSTLIVLSEIYYPEGWTATLDNQTALEIMKTNHLLRSMAVPAGSHRIVLSFEPSTFRNGVTISWIGWIITYLGLAFMGYMKFTDGRKKERFKADSSA